MITSTKHVYKQIQNIFKTTIVDIICMLKGTSNSETCVQCVLCGITRAGTNTPSDEYDTYRDTGWRIRYVSRIHFFSEAKLGNG